MTTDDHMVANDSMQMAWDPPSRVAFVRYARDANLTAADGAFMIDALTRWIGPSGMPFAVLADGAGLRGTEGPYRATVSRFFAQHRDDAFIALVNLGPVIHVVVEMFRIGTGIQLRTFANEALARAWLRAKGIAA